MPMGLHLGLGLGSSQQATAQEWTPALLPNINTWFDAKQGIVLDGARVATWTDVINGKVYTGAALTAAPTYDNTDKALVFDSASGQYMTRTHTLNAQTNLTYIFIFKMIDDTTKYQYLLDHNGTVTQIRMGFTSYSGTPKTGYAYMYGGVSMLLAAVSLAKQQAAYRMYLYNYLTNNGSTSKITAYKAKADGTDLTLAATAVAATNTFNNDNPLYLGRLHSGNDRYLNGKLKSIISIVGTPLNSDIETFIPWATAYYSLDVE